MNRGGLVSPTNKYTNTSAQDFGHAEIEFRLGRTMHVVMLFMTRVDKQWCGNDGGDRGYGYDDREKSASPGL